MTTNESDLLHFLKTRELDFDLVGKYEVPCIKGIKLKDLSSVKLIGFNYATNIKSMQERGNEFVHFFLPDTYIERVWDNPDYYGAVFAQYKGIIQPDLSQYTTMPRAMQIWNYYRNMWLAAHYQSQGIRVIPQAQWSDEDSYEYCFDGVPKGSCVCISSVGCVQNVRARTLFGKGLREAVKRIQPSQIIFRGVITEDFQDAISGIPYVHLDSEMKQRIDAYKNKLENS